MPFVSYAQNFEDVVLWRALKHIENGFYVDVGAAWPDTHSVTKAFYDRGWCGINVEPNPELYLHLCEQRSRDINLQLAVSKRDGEVELNFFADTGLSTLDSEIAERHVKKRFNYVPLKVNTTTLASLLHRYLPKQQEIHFLKVDVEGLEAEVLTSNDWSIFLPWVVIIESTLPLSQVESHHLWEPELLAASYTLAYTDGLNRYYIENSHLDLLAAFKYPPNVFDEFVLASQVAAEEFQRVAETRAIAAEELQRMAEARAVAAEEFQRVAETRAIAAEELQRMAEARAVAAEEFQRVAETRAIAAEELQRMAEARAVAAEEFQRLTEARVSILTVELSSMINSKSWRITAPMREIVLQSRRLKIFAKLTLSRIVGIKPKGLLVLMLKSLIKLAYRYPLIKKPSLIFLYKFPGIKLRISQVLSSQTESIAGKAMKPDPYCELRLKKIEKIVACVLDDLRSQK